MQTTVKRIVLIIQLIKYQKNTSMQYLKQTNKFSPIHPQSPLSQIFYQTYFILTSASKTFFKS